MLFLGKVLVFFLWDESVILMSMRLAAKLPNPLLCRVRG